MDDMTLPAIAEPTELRQERVSLAQQVLTAEIATETDKVRLGNALLALKALRKKITEHYRPIKQAIDKSKRTILDQEAADLAPVEEAERVGGGKIIAWDTEQQRLRNEEIRRREAEARQKAEADRQEQIEAMRRAAAKAKREGDAAAAAALRDQANRVKETEVIAVYEAPPEPVAVKGLTAVETWDATVVDKMALIRAVAAGTVSASALDVNATWLRQQAQALREQFNVPGCQATATKSLRGRPSAAGY